MIEKEKFLLVLCAAIAATPAALGGDGDKRVVEAEEKAEQSALSRFFGYATLYEDETNPIMQKFALSGRLQADAAASESNEGSFEGLSWRRFRFGFKTQIFENFTLHSEADLELNDPVPLYEKLTDTNIAWSTSDAFKLKIGKQGTGFTLDGSTSSKKLLRMERSLVSNNLWFTQEYFTGVAISGKTGKWVYNAGVFSGDGGAEFGDFEAGYFGLISIGYDFGDALGLDKALIRADYVNNNPTGEGDLNTRDLYQVGSLNGKFELGDWGVWTDIAVGEGYDGQSDLFGFDIMPFYNVSEKLQLVASYNIVNGDNGVRLDRYENRVVIGRADRAQELYAGVNCYFYSHKLKWQTGVEYTIASDASHDGGEFSGWGLSSGIRISW